MLQIINQVERFIDRILFATQLPQSKDLVGSLPSGPIPWQLSIDVITVYKVIIT